MRAWLSSFFGSLVLLAGVAHGYTIESAAAGGCHERITADAWRVVRAELAAGAEIVPSTNERALIEDLQFRPALDMRDLAGVTLLLAVRDPDLMGRGSTDLTELAEVHGDPGHQLEHCLRGPDQKEPEGTAEAIRDCRGFIREQILRALDGLDEAGVPDAQKRTPFELTLEVRGRLEALLPTYFVEIGPALHAMQDSFTHTYRTPDAMRVTVALNWLDYAQKQLVEERDGPAHSSALDSCDDADDLRTRRRELATDASVELLRTTLNPTLSREEKMAAVDATLNQYLTYEPGCGPENQWCNAPEAGYPTGSGCGCSAGGGLGLLGAAFALAAWRLRRRAAPMLTGLLLLALPLANAHAGGLEDGLSPPPPVAAPVPMPVAEPMPPNPAAGKAWGIAVNVAGSLDEPALAGSLGARLRLSQRWALGLDAEWNPYLATHGRKFREGGINFYATAILRFPLAYQAINLRSTLSVGGSYLLTELYGAPEGSIGLYGGISPLGLEVKASRHIYLVINPMSIAVPVPHLTGVPFVYPQYRFTIGLEFYGA